MFLWAIVVIRSKVKCSLKCWRYLVLWCRYAMQKIAMWVSMHGSISWMMIFVSSISTPLISRGSWGRVSTSATIIEWVNKFEVRFYFKISVNPDQELAEDSKKFNAFKSNWINLKCAESNGMLTVVYGSAFERDVSNISLLESATDKLCFGPKFTEYQATELSNYLYQMQKVFTETQVCLPSHFDVCKNLDRIEEFTYVRPSIDGNSVEPLDLPKVIQRKYNTNFHRSYLLSNLTISIIAVCIVCVLVNWVSTMVATYPIKSISMWRNRMTWARNSLKMPYGLRRWCVWMAKRIWIALWVEISQLWSGLIAHSASTKSFAGRGKVGVLLLAIASARFTHMPSNWWMLGQGAMVKSPSLQRTEKMTKHFYIVQVSTISAMYGATKQSCPTFRKRWAHSWSK